MFMLAIWYYSYLFRNNEVIRCAFIMCVDVYSFVSACLGISNKQIIKERVDDKIGV